MDRWAKEMKTSNENEAIIVPHFSLQWFWQLTRQGMEDFPTLPSLLITAKSECPHAFFSMVAIFSKNIVRVVLFDLLRKTLESAIVDASIEFVNASSHSSLVLFFIVRRFFLYQSGIVAFLTFLVHMLIPNMRIFLSFVPFWEEQ